MESREPSQNLGHTHWVPCNKYYESQGLSPQERGNKRGVNRQGYNISRAINRDRQESSQRLVPFIKTVGASLTTVTLQPYF